MDSSQFKENIFVITQSVIALFVVAGTGILLATGNSNAELAVGIAGSVIGYFFSVISSKSNNTNPLNYGSSVPTENEK